MKFVTFRHEGETGVGVLARDQVYRIEQFTDMLTLIAAGEQAIEAGRQTLNSIAPVPLASVKLLAPIPRPPRIFGIGLNYAKHAAESGLKPQAVPTVFMKLSSSVVGPDEAVVLPSNSTQPDYEAELGFVIGRPGYRISAERWREYVFGYTIVNDVSARDIQMATSQWTLGKSFPTFTPMGPAIVTSDEIADPQSLDISLTLNGETMQSSNTRDLIFGIPKLVEHLSSLTPLEVGDVVSTGTPEGVGMGRKPQRWLRPGEELRITIAGVGELRNPVAAETTA